MAIHLLIPGCDKEDPLPEPYGRVNGFLISTSGEKFLATSDGLYTFNEEKSRIEPSANTGLDAPYYDLAISNKEKELWLASHTGAFNSVTKEYLDTSNSGLAGNEVNHMTYDVENTFYFSTPEGISLLNQGNWLLYTGQDEFFLDFEVSDMAAATNGFTYVCTRGGGIERFSSGVDGITGATLFDTDWTRLNSNTIHSVFIDDTLQAYGTDGGAALHFSEHTKKDWLVYTSEDGLANDTVLAIVRDHADSWWFGTVQGISRLNGARWTSYSMESHSLISNQVKFLAVDPEGAVWMAADEGLAKYENDQWISYPK
jgi:ligand-binding sensor domain-containing protein